MQTKHDLDSRFGDDAARRLARLIGLPPTGDAAIRPASRDRCRGALIGALASEALPAILMGRRTAAGADTLLTLIVADAVLSGVHDHPVRFAARLAATRVRGAGRAAHHTRKALRAGRPWWRAGATNSAGSGAAARSSVFGLLWSGDPARAAYEAALSATVTHGHPAAIAGAAALAAAIALASSGEGPLDRAWLARVADICDEYPQGTVYGANVADRIRRLPDLLDAGLDDALDALGGTAIATEAVPAALLAAVAAPVATSASTPAAGWSLEAVAGLHPTCRTMIGACIGARRGEGTLQSRVENPLAAGVPDGTLARIQGVDAVLATADRVAGRRIRPPQPQPPRPREEGAEVPVHISFLIDRSGSMSGLESDVVAGFNGFVTEQREKPEECALTLVQFDSNDPYEVIHDAVPLGKIPDLTPDRYQPRGSTPLLDALGRLIENADTRLAGIDRDEDQIVAVFTDGLENASRRWTRARLFDAITDRQDAGWTFVFMGANQDSYEEAGRLGLAKGSVQDFRADKKGVHAAFGSFNRAMREYRGAAQDERRRRKKDFWAGKKEAEEDDRARGDSS